MSYTHWIRSLVARYLLALTDRKRMLLHLVSGVAMIAAFRHSIIGAGSVLQGCKSVEPNQFRPERLYIHSQHAAEPNPGNRRRRGDPTSPQPVRYPALCVAV